MTNRVLCGFHALKSAHNDNQYFPVCVYFKYENRLSYRETGLVIDEPSSTLEACLDVIDDAIQYTKVCKREQVTGVEYSERELAESVLLDPLIVTYPGKERIGETVEGKVVGWHVDLKTNGKRKNNPACLIANLAFMNQDGEVNFVIVDKMPIQASSAEDISRQIHQVFDVMNESYLLGGTLRLNVVPQGKHRAKYSIVEYIAPLVFEEVICDALKSTLG